MLPTEFDSPDAFAALGEFLAEADAAALIRSAPALCRVIPELAPTVGFDQHSPHHAYDVYTHTAHVLEAVPRERKLRWAALLHDIGKVPTFTQDANGRGHFYGHAQAGAEMADGVLRRLNAPEEVREDVVWLIGNHMTRLTPNRQQLRQYLTEFGRERLYGLLALQEADMASKGTDEDDGSGQFARVREILEELTVQPEN